MSMGEPDDIAPDAKTYTWHNEGDYYIASVDTRGIITDLETT